MTDYRCQHRKSDGRQCNALLFRAEDFSGELQIRCYRCNQDTVIDRRPTFTAFGTVTPLTLDKLPYV